MNHYPFRIGTFPVNAGSSYFDLPTNKLDIIMKNQKSLPKENTDSTVNAMTEEIQKLQREVEKLRQEEKRQQKTSTN